MPTLWQNVSGFTQCLQENSMKVHQIRSWLRHDISRWSLHLGHHFMKLSDSEDISFSRVLQCVGLLNMQVLGMHRRLISSMCSRQCGVYPFKFYSIPMDYILLHSINIALQWWIQWHLLSEVLLLPQINVLCDRWKHATHSILFRNMILVSTHWELP